MITNLKALAQTPLRKKALLIANTGLEAINIERVIREKINLKNEILEIESFSGEKRQISKITKIDLNKFKRVFILGIGKGSALACSALVKKLGKKITAGIALDIQKPKSIVHSPLFRVFIGTHPLPSEKNIKATKEIVKTLESLNADDLLIAFICGGGSALLCESKDELKYSQFIFKKLTEAGADIFEINTVRKHFSSLKGGGLTKLAYPATIFSLIISDVIGNDLSMVASGPTVFDKTTKKDAEKIIKRYFNIKTSDVSNIDANLKISDVKKLIYSLKETPKNKKYFKKVKNILFISNKDVVLTMAKKAEQLNLKSKIYSFKLRGEAKNVFDLLFKALKDNDIILAGGETTVKLQTANSKEQMVVGKGGRNQEAVLGAIVKMIHNKKYVMHNCVFLSIASDGRDNTEAAGAISDHLTLEKAKKLKLSPEKFLEEHNSFNFFKKTGDLIYADQNSFNVSDFMVLLKSKE